jgi:hypothetical protein
MNYITGRHLPRRTFLRGMGAAVSLPFLEAMIPAGRLLSDTKSILNRPRLIAIEQVHGAAGCAPGLGTSMNLWNPVGIGRDFTLEQHMALYPIEEAGFRDQLTIISNTDCRMAEAFQPAEVGGDHFRSSAVFLTQAHPKQTQGSDVYVGTSMDQLFAQQLGQDTPVPSMQLCIENIDMQGGCLYGYTCLYTDSVSWASPTDPLPMVRDPRVAFEQLFGAGRTAEERTYRMQNTGSILDWIMGESSRLSRSLGASDRRRLEGYTESIRELERRIQMTVARNTSGEEREIPEAPAGVPDSFQEHMEIMFDLQALAFESDTTRVFTFKPGRDGSARVYPASGVANGFHPASHHANRPEALTDFNRINQYHVSMLPYLMRRLRDVQEGDSNLLEQTTIIYGSHMADPNIHNHRRVPLVLLGGGAGTLEGGVHIKAGDGTPMANVLLSLMNGMGMEMESFGDSTGTLALKSSPARTSDTY